MQQVAGSLFESELPSLDLIHRGKVRDIYAVDDAHMLIVTSDRLSAFDVVLPDPIPGKGAVLTDLSHFWFERTSAVVKNQLSRLSLEEVVPDEEERQPIEGRAVVVQRLKALPLEAIVRGYLIGSGWKDYQTTGAVSGIKLPAGLRQADKLPDTIFTPSTKADVGEHDENISYAEIEKMIGGEIAGKVRDISIRLYEQAAAFALERGIIIADTKFEFGLNGAGEIVLIDEVLTPDSSRFWPASEYAPGSSPPSFDKQFVRDYLETLDWNKKPPAPSLPQDVIERTAEKYAEARRRLVQ
ncbi:MAG TPA: phosphoribosylaminoimidazolesuccinocarboxamide synthase [Gammaproteobacteria bacterium]